MLKLIRVVALVVLFYLLYKLLWKNEKSPFGKQKKNKDNQSPVEPMKKDPVCGLYIPESQAIIVQSDKGTLYFCSKECQEKYNLQQKI